MAFTNHRKHDIHSGFAEWDGSDGGSKRRDFVPYVKSCWKMAEVQFHVHLVHFIEIAGVHMHNLAMCSIHDQIVSQI